jgi:hypothetical protein
MTFTLTFSEPQDVTTPGQDGAQYSCVFTIVDSALIGTPEERSQTSERRFIIGMSRTRRAGWQISDANLPKILFEFGKRYIVSLVESHALPEDYTIRCPMISIASHSESECRFDPAAIPSPVGFTIEVKQRKPPIGFL